MVNKFLSFNCRIFNKETMFPKIRITKFINGSNILFKIKIFQIKHSSSVFKFSFLYTNFKFP